MQIIRRPARTACPHARIRWRVALVSLSAAALLVSYAVTDKTIGYDGEQYLTYARNLLQSGQFTYDGINPSCGRAPGYPLFLAVVLRLFGDVRLVYPFQLLFLFVGLWFVARTFAAHAPLASYQLLLASLSFVWPLHSLAMAIKTEPLFLSLTAVSLFLLHRHLVDGGRYTLIGSGLLFGLSAYVRPINFLAAPFLAVVLLWRGRLTWKRALVYGVVGLSVVVPWTIRNAIVFDRFVPMAAHHGSVYYMTDAGLFWPVLLRSAGYTHSLPVYRDIVGDRLELDWEAAERYWARARANIARDPAGFVWRCLVKSVFVWSYLPGTKGWVFEAPWWFAVGIVVQLVFLLTAFLGLRRLHRAGSSLPTIIGGYALYTTLVLLPLYSESRFLLPVHVWLFGGAWVYVASRLQSTRVVKGLVATFGLKPDPVASSDWAGRNSRPVDGEVDQNAGGARLR